MNSLRFYIVFFSFIMFQISVYGMSDDSLVNHLKEAFNRPTFDENDNYYGNLDNPDEVISVTEFNEIESLLVGQSKIGHEIQRFESVNLNLDLELPRYNPPVILEGFSRDLRIKFAKLLAARAQCKYKYVDVNLLYTGALCSDAEFLRELIFPITIQPSPCVIILDRFMCLLKQKDDEKFIQFLPTGVLCHLLNNIEANKNLFFIGLRGDMSEMPPRLEKRLWHRVYLKDPKESMWQTMYNYLFKQPTDS